MQYQASEFSGGFADSTLSLHVVQNIDSGRLHLFDYTVGLDIYVPEGYAENKALYPVLFFINGDRAFYSPDSSGWYVDETMDSLLQHPKIKSSLVVAVKNISFLKGEEDSVASFLCYDVKSYVDSRYRTAPGQAVLVGAGKFAAIALMTVLKYPQVFSRAGIFSPDERLEELVKEKELTGKGFKGMLFFYNPGSKNSERIVDKLAVESSGLLYATRKQNPRRQKSILGGWYAEFYKWITGNGFNYIVRPPRR